MNLFMIFIKWKIIIKLIYNNKILLSYKENLGYKKVLEFLNYQNKNN